MVIKKVNNKSVTISVKTDPKLTKNGLKKTHFRTIATLTTQHRDNAYLLASVEKANSNIKKPFKKAVIKIKSFWCGVRMDYDGLACSVAPAIDGMVDAEIILDDNPSIVQGYYMEYVNVKTRKEVHVEVCIQSVQ